MNKFCLGRECKPGWGHDESLNRLIPVEGKLLSPSWETVNRWWYDYYSFPISSTTVTHWKLINLLLEPTCRRKLDFEIIFDDDQYWEFRCCFKRRSIKCKKFPKYPSNCSHFVSRVDYGVDLWILLSKVEFPEGREKIGNLLKERRFNKEQKKRKCRVMIHYKEIREMTLGELIKFIEELDDGKHSQYDVPVIYDIKILTVEFRKTIISNQKEFGTFLSHLYCTYRKIEIKMELNGYPDILPDLDSKEQSFIKICSHLDRAKENYNWMRSNDSEIHSLLQIIFKPADRYDFLKMYSVMKKLFICYIYYLRYSIHNNNKIDEGDHLPRNIYEMTLWSQELNAWFPMEINKKWINCMCSLIVIPRGYEQVAETLRNTTKFSNSLVVDDDEALEPYIAEQDNKKILFGLISMEMAEWTKFQNNLILFELECPEKCTPHLRRWVCTKCGEFVRINPTFEEQLLYCTCGSQRYKNKLFICHHPSHRQQESDNNQTKQDDFPFPDIKDIQDQTFNCNGLLPLICRKLLQTQVRSDGTTDERILIIINYLSNNRNEEEIKSSLRGLQDITLDRYIRYMIDLYLNKNS